MSAGRQGSNPSLRISNSKGRARRVPMGGVDPGAVGVERARRAGSSRILLALGEIADAEGAHQPVAGHPRLAGDLREPPAGDAAVEVHLPEPVLGVDEPLPEPEVGAAGGGDVRDAPAIPGDLQRPADSRHREVALGLRQRPPQQPMPGDGDRCGAEERARRRAGKRRPHDLLSGPARFHPASIDDPGASATRDALRQPPLGLQLAEVRPHGQLRRRDEAPPGRRPRPRRAAPPASARRARGRRAGGAPASSGARRTRPASPRGR